MYHSQKMIKTYEKVEHSIEMDLAGSTSLPRIQIYDLLVWDIFTWKSTVPCLGELIKIISSLSLATGKVD